MHARPIKQDMGGLSTRGIFPKMYNMQAMMDNNNCPTIKIGMRVGIESSFLFQ